MYLRVFFALTLLLQCAAVAQFQGAREKFDAYRQGEERLASATASVDAEAAQQAMRQQILLLTDARRLFEEQQVLKRGTPEDLATYSEVLAATGDFDLAADALKEAIRQAPASPAFWVLLGQHLMQVGPAARQECFQTFQRALQMNLSPEQAAEAHYGLGKLYHQQGLVDFAFDEYTKALDSLPGHVPANIAVAALRTRRGEVAAASEILDQLGRAAQPYDAETRIMLRHALFEFTELGRTFEDTFENHAAYSRLLYRAGRLPEAALVAQRAVVLNPQSYETLNFIATMHMQMGNLSYLREALEKSLAVNPNQPEVRAGLENLPAPEAQPGAGTPPMLQRPDEEAAPPAAPEPAAQPES